MLTCKRGQVWIETVLYTLIGLALIGLVLAFATPRINEAKDRLAVEQAIESLNALDEKINAVSIAPGNVRFVDFTLKRGELHFLPAPENKIRFILFELTKPYSEPGSVIRQGRLDLVTTEEQKGSSINLTIDYGSLILTVNDGGTEPVKFNPASLPYRFSVKSTAVNQVDITEVSG